MEDSNLKQLHLVDSELMEPKIEAELITPDYVTPNLFPTICIKCKEQNLIQKAHIVLCSRCNTYFCIHFASSIDPSFCADCCHAVEMMEQTVYKKSEHYNEDKDKVYTKTSKARQIQFSGLDWLFFQRRIEQITDLELELAIEYHRGLYNFMMFERDKRRAEHAHRNAGKKLIIPTSNQNVVTSTTTKVKKTRTIKSLSPEAKVAALKTIIENLMKQGKTQAEIMSLLSGQK